MFLEGLREGILQEFCRPDRSTMAEPVSPDFAVQTGSKTAKPVLPVFEPLSCLLNLFPHLQSARRK